MVYLQLGYHFLAIRIKDFVFVIYQTQNLYGIDLSVKIKIIELMIIHMVMTIFQMHI
jgi:hypothetical protein